MPCQELPPKLEIEKEEEIATATAKEPNWGCLKPREPEGTARTGRDMFQLGPG